MDPAAPPQYAEHVGPAYKYTRWLWSTASLLSVFSVASVGSIASVMSVCSVGCSFSVLSIGCTWSILRDCRVAKSSTHAPFPMYRDPSAVWLSADATNDHAASISHGRYVTRLVDNTTGSHKPGTDWGIEQSEFRTGVITTPGTYTFAYTMSIRSSHTTKEWLSLFQIKCDNTAAPALMLMGGTASPYDDEDGATGLSVRYKSNPTAMEQMTPLYVGEYNHTELYVRITYNGRTHVSVVVSNGVDVYGQFNHSGPTRCVSPWATFGLYRGKPNGNVTHRMYNLRVGKPIPWADYIAAGTVVIVFLFLWPYKQCRIRAVTLSLLIALTNYTGAYPTVCSVFNAVCLTMSVCIWWRAKTQASVCTAC